jgi:hypothetical protein
MGPSRFTSHPKEGVLRIFFALKNPSPWPRSNPQPLGAAASTLTTTPPRRRYDHTNNTWRKSAYYKAAQYEIFSSLLSLHLSSHMTHK